VALISHLPQIIASLLAGALDGRSGDRAFELAGAGLRDTTRIAASAPELWSDILSSNSHALKPLLQAVAANLNELIDHLDETEFIAEFIAKGNRGRSAIPGKHGGVSRTYSYLSVVIDDKPGQLAALFDECALAQVNVEDLSIEHSPEQRTGLITLSLSSEDAAKLSAHLQSAKWRVHIPQ
jgi:prephenate dehydrogenase